MLTMITYDPEGLSNFRTDEDGFRKFDWSIETMFHYQSNFRKLSKERCGGSTI